MSDAAPAKPVLVIISGMSGAGKSVALKTLEEIGFYCVDNLPVELLDAFVRSLTGKAGVPNRLAVGIDVRNRLSDLAQAPQLLGRLAEFGIEPQLVFFDSDTASLLKRYADTRRRHPLGRQGVSLADAIARERDLLQPLRDTAHKVVDTSQFNVHQLRRHVLTELGLAGESAPSLLFESFSYRKGLPLEADFVLDARVLPNPHWQAELRPLSGRDAPVREFLDAQPEVRLYVKQIGDFLDAWLPQLHSDTRSYVTVAFGCTGGKHRSVYLAETLARRAREHGWQDVAVFHRELD